MNLKEILEKHHLFLQGDKDGERANLRDVNLHGAYLSGANLRGAYLRDTDLSDTDLRDTDLSGANLSDANLRGADLRGANLYGADLRGAYLSGTDLRDANLRDANLHGAIHSSKYIITLQVGNYFIVLHKDFIKIGCKIYTLEEWETFSETEIREMDGQKGADWFNKYFKTIKILWATQFGE